MEWFLAKAHWNQQPFMVPWHCSKKIYEPYVQAKNHSHHLKRLLVPHLIDYTLNFLPILTFNSMNIAYATCPLWGPQYFCCLKTFTMSKKFSFKFWRYQYFLLLSLLLQMDSLWLNELQCPQLNKKNPCLSMSYGTYIQLTTNFKLALKIFFCFLRIGLWKWKTWDQLWWRAPWILPTWNLSNPTHSI